MSFSRWRAFCPLLAGIASLTFSCGRREEPAVQRLAILRFENLTPDTSTEWISAALPEVIVAELAAAPGIYAIPTTRLHAQGPAFGIRPTAAPGISAEPQLAQAIGATRVGYGEFAIAGGRLSARLTIEDPSARRVAQGPIEVSVDAKNVIEAATLIARQISPGQQPYGTSNMGALSAYIHGVEAADPGTVRGYAGEATALDPNYGPPFLLMAETALRQQDRPGAQAALQAGSAAGTKMQEGSARRIDVLAATLRGDLEGVERGLTALSKAAPLDPTIWRSLAEAAAARRRYDQSISAFQQSLAIEPESVAAWNELGYTAAYAGKLDVAMSALRRYQMLRPSDPNPLDSMGDVNLLTGHLKEAESLYLEAHKKNPAFLNGLALMKAATARLMTGDVMGANGIAGERAGSAEWLWLIGKRKEALDRLVAQTAQITDRDAQGRTYAQAAIWALLLNDRDAASRLAAQGVAVATPATAGALTLSRFATMPSAPAAEWMKRADQLFPSPTPSSVKDLGLVYALLLDGHFGEASPILRNLESRVGATGDRSLALDLAWALIETGKMEEAAPLLSLTPVLAADNARPFVGLYFPKIFRLRAIVAERAGKQDEARENRRVYAALGGQ